MHTGALLSSEDFAIALDGRPATIADLLPGFTVDARVAIVSRRPGAPFGAATLLLALVTAWYEERRRRAAGAAFHDYPDWFLLQVGGEHADLGMLEVWPPRKHVVVEPDAEQLLGALSDRAVDYLLVEDGEPRRGQVLRETRNALRLRAALAYDPSGRAAGADVVVTGRGRSEQLVAQSIADSTNVPEAVRDGCRAARARISADGASVERLRRIDLDTALGLLVPPPGGRVRRPFGLSPRDRSVARLQDGVPPAMLTEIGPA